MYKYETHSHTVESSVCGEWPAAEMVEIYHKLGYTGICITDHLHMQFLNGLNHGGDWQYCVDQYMMGYKNAKAAGEKYGMDVIFGIELLFTEDRQKEYLLYGVDEEWLRNCPWPCTMGHEKFFRDYGKDILVIQAHPYRNNHNVHLDSIHGVEVVNRHPRIDSRSQLAVELAREHPDLYRLCGSDAHRWGDEGRAAMLVENRIRDSHELKQVIMSRNYSLWHDAWEPGGMIYTPDSICD